MIPVQDSVSTGKTKVTTVHVSLVSAVCPTKLQESLNVWTLMNANSNKMFARALSTSVKIELEVSIVPVSLKDLTGVLKTKSALI